LCITSADPISHTTSVSSVLISFLPCTAKTPDSVDKLIQGILDGTGKGGVVTTEFNQGGVHATIISNVNELKITEVGK